MSNNIIGNRNSTPVASKPSIRGPATRTIGTAAASTLRSQQPGAQDDSNRLGEQWIQDIEQYETMLEEMAAATLDQDFKDELSAIEQWFKVLSEAERTAATYALIQQTTQMQQRFFAQVLNQMSKSHPISAWADVVAEFCMLALGLALSSFKFIDSAPVKEEHIFLDSAYDFYPDYRSLIMTLPYYDYLSVGASKKNDPNWVAVDQPESGPKTFLYLPSSDLQGIHPPAPIYQSNQAPQAATGMYYFPGVAAQGVAAQGVAAPGVAAPGVAAPGVATQPAGYYHNGCNNGFGNAYNNGYSNAYCYGATNPLATGWQLTSSPFSNTLPYLSVPSMGLLSYPYPSAASYNYTLWSNTYSPYSASSMPYACQAPAAAMPWCAQAAQAQASSCLAMNAALAAAPQAPYYFVGATPAEMQAQNSYIATNIMQMPQAPTQLVPFKPGTSQQFWVKELDGSWTLREYNDVIMGEIGPGHWERHATSGYFYYVRHPM
ncbi:hypothetical protein DV735_g4008, partial [Chaetothyriales sp. CBS 134920]